MLRRGPLNQRRARGIPLARDDPDMRWQRSVAAPVQSPASRPKAKDHMLLSDRGVMDEAHIGHLDAKLARYSAIRTNRIKKHISTRRSGGFMAVGSQSLEIQSTLGCAVNVRLR